MTSPSVILHLSDLHFTDKPGHYWNNPDECYELRAGIAPHDQRGLLGSLLLDLGRQNVTPDFIVISGDILDRANPQGVELAKQFINDLASKLKTDRDRIILVPGNHDIIQGDSIPGKYNLFRQIWDGVCSTPLDKANPPHKMAYIRTYRDFGLEFVAFNSCESLSERNPQGSIGAGQRDYVEAELRQTANLKLYRVAVLHHHIEKPSGISSRYRTDYSEIVDAALVREWLVERGFQLVLHGHQHVAWEYDRVMDGKILKIAAGGSAGVGDYARKDWNLPITYQLITLHRNSGTQCTVSRRQYITRKLEFGPADSEQIHSRHGEHTEDTLPADLSYRVSMESNIKLASLILFDRYERKVEAYYINRGIDQKLELAAQMKGVWLYGASGHGKTSCLLRCMDKLKTKVFYVSLGSIIDGKSTSVLNQLYIDICDRFGFPIRKTKEMNCNEIIRTIANALGEVQNQDQVIYLDEMPFDEPHEVEELAKSMAAIVLLLNNRSSERKLRFLISSINNPLINIRKNQSQIYEHLFIEQCPPWQRTEMSSLLELAQTNLHLLFTPEEKVLLLDSAQGSPRYLKSFLWKWVLQPPGVKSTVARILSEVNTDLRSR